MNARIRMLVIAGAIGLQALAQTQEERLDPTGSYALDILTFDLDSTVFLGNWSFDVALIGRDSVAVSFSACRGWPSYNLGYLEEDTVAYDGHHAVCGSPDDSLCVITLTFTPGHLHAEQSPDATCGFGMGVYADGEYIKQPDGPHAEWYDTLHVDCGAPLPAVRAHLGHLNADDLDGLLNSFHPACMHDTAYRKAYSDLLLRALDEAPALFMERLEATEHGWQEPVVLYTLSRIAEGEVDLEPVKEHVAAVETTNEWLQRRILEALDGNFE